MFFPQEQAEVAEPSGWHVYDGERYVGVVFAGDEAQALSKGRMIKGDQVTRIKYRCDVVEKET